MSTFWCYNAQKYARIAGEVRRRVFRQLLESLLYEGALRAEEIGEGRYAIDGVDAAGAPVRYEFSAHLRYGFDRISVGSEPIRRVARDSDTEADSTTRFLSEVRDGLSHDAVLLPDFARELEATLVNDALAQYVRTRRGDVLAGADYDTLEATVTDGHRYHPAYKSRMGFDLDDNAAFGPEFAEPVYPVWLAARLSITHATVSDSVLERDFLAEQLGTRTIEEFHERIRAAGGEPSDYVLLPVHPWQWRERITHAFAPRLWAAELIVLGEDPHAHRAQQSIRTLACRDTPRRAYLKLSLSIVNTSTSRALAPHTVRNAPPISDWLHRIVARDEYLRDELRTVLLGEVMGVAVDPPPVADLVRADSYGALAGIWRESLHTYLDPDERAVPFNGITARERDGTPLIDGWVREFGVRSWVSRLLEVSVLPVMRFLLRHGIALEAHAQNMVLLHRSGWPQRVALRDFHDGVRFSRAALAEPALCPELAGTPEHHVNRNSFVQTDDLDLVSDFVLDAFFFINLGELGMFLEDAYALPEPEFWTLVRGTIEYYIQRFGGGIDKFDVFKPTIEVEQLTTRRLLPDTELRLHRVSNPLSRGGKG
ncbi:MAG: siderophore biosynthesis protein [Pseudonocardiaceae bacterium]|nr:siderophore biosynthesis protein [Pseudonocardiaceae bacterium]